MNVLKTLPHQGQTLAHGPFEVTETIHVCARRCEDDRGRLITMRQPEVTQILMPRRQVGYDVMTSIGLRRFLEAKQREEIQTDLQNEYGFTLSTGQISKLSGQFLEYLEALHVARAPALAQALAKDGGWPLHIDATGEDGRGTLFAAYAGWRGWVLGAWKIPTERADAILPRLMRTADLFGDPCAIMRDLGKAVIEAAQDFVAKRGLQIPILGCHFHFLRDVGKDLLTKWHNELRALFSRFHVTRRLGTLVRDVGRGLGIKIDQAREGVRQWLCGPVDNLQLPDGPEGIAVVRALAQWCLDFRHDGNKQGFPFDQPYLDFYQRCSRALRAVEAHLWAPWSDTQVRGALERLHGALEPIRSELPFQQPVSILKERVELLDELRRALRLHVKPEPGSTQSPDNQIAELRDIKAEIEGFTARLRERRPERGPAQRTREAIDIVVDHLDRHGPSLWGHEVALVTSDRKAVRLVARTNLILERFWHVMKHHERRRSGRKVLSYDFENLPAAAALAYNLTRPDYVEILCGTLDQLAPAFAELDAERRRVRPPDAQPALPAGSGDVERAAADNALHDDVGTDDIVTTASASMPVEDRPIFRAKAMDARVSRAVASRAPRWSSP